MTPWMQYSVFAITLIAGLTALAWTDAKTFRLPNKMTYPLIVFGVGSAFVLPHLAPRDALLGLCVGYGGFVALELIFRKIYGKHGLGRGDAKLLAAGGAWCGIFGLPFIILIASLSGLVFTQLPSQRERLGQEKAAIPFGPFLAAGIAVIWFGQIWFWFN